MIAYVQADGSAEWNDRIKGWINALAGKEPGWTAKDLLTLDAIDTTRHLARLSSVHARQKSLADIELRHLWIEMKA
jgi:hypothetical protein